MKKLSAEKLAAAFGVSAVTIRAWRNRGITDDDFINPFTMADKLHFTGKRNSPRIRLLDDPKVCGDIVFRMAIAGIIS